MVATAAARSAGVSCWAASGVSGVAASHARTSERVSMRLIYLLLFMAPQALIYLYLRDRLPDPTRPRQARLLRAALATVFVVFNLPWLAVARRALRVRHLERLPAPRGHAPHADLPRAPARP